jgi:hypothetical protein
MNSLWDIRIFLGLVPKESPCTYWANPRSEETLIKILNGNREGERQTGKTRRRWETNAEWILNGVGCEHIDWNVVTQVTEQGPAFVNTVKKFSVSFRAGNFYLLFK